MKNLNFSPWIGRNYSSSPQKILIVGDSHYWSYADEPIAYNENFTQYIISDDTSLKTTFFKNTAKMYGKENFSELRDQIAFCNAIQDFMLNPNDTPTVQQLKNTEFSIAEYIRLTQPDKVVVLSFRIWEHLFNKTKTWGNYKEHIHGANKKTTIWELYPIPNHQCLAMGMYHPSAQGWKLEDWKPILEEFLAK